MTKTQKYFTLTNLVEVLTAILLLQNLLSYFPQIYFGFELLSHFRPQYCFLSLLSSIYFLIVKQKLWSSLCLICLSINLFSILPIYLEHHPQTPVKTPTLISAMSINVLALNQNKKAVIDLIKAKNPTLISLQEVNNSWDKSLVVLDKTYPYKLVIPQEDNFGIALFSQLPLTESKVITYTKNSGPSITAKIEFQNTNIDILVTHPRPPINKMQFDQRNQHIINLSRSISINSNTILMGDLNVSMWSPYYKPLGQIAGLTNSRQGFGVFPTWPMHLPLLQIPIDHILVSSKFKILKTERLKHIGSDHLPIYCELEI
ncbi:MAG: endonuclease/exonuclease/phosphatase family protein [Candidatus Cloacimonetes bacterium]|nr:endonuclease/exonuclease/phosphatase family protein [Candidatus Cloacimonadota bacterium]